MSNELSFTFAAARILSCGNKKNTRERIRAVAGRYYRTMNLLLDAIKSVDKAFFFDNSKSQPALFAKYENNHIDIISQEMIPRWFYEYVLDKL